MSENSKIHLQRLKTGIASAIIASVAISNTPAVVKAEGDTYEELEITNAGVVFEGADTNTAISAELEEENKEAEVIEQAAQDEPEVVNSETAGLEITGQENIDQNEVITINEELTYSEADSGQFDSEDQDETTNLPENSKVDTLQNSNEDSEFLNEATLKSIIFDKDEYMYGEEAYITITLASDTPVDTIEIELERKFNNSSEHRSTIWLSDFIENSNGDYEVTTQLYIEEDLIGLELISAYYQISHIGQIAFTNIPDIQSLNFVPSPETAGPELKDIIFDKEEYEPGEIVQYEIHLTHIRNIESLDLSISGDNYSSNREYFDYIYDFSYDEINNHFVGKGSFQVPENTIDDKYTIESIYVRDIQDNHTVYNEYNQNNHFENNYFKVVNSGVTDINGPIVEDIIIDYGPHQRGEEIEITVIASDESAIDYLILEFKSNDYEFGHRFESVDFYDFKLNNEGYYESTTTFIMKDSDTLDFNINTIYFLEYGAIYDIYGNQTNIQVDEFPLSIELYGKPDIEAPVIIDITADKAEYAPGETAIITITLADESDMDSVRIVFAGEENNYREFDAYISEFTKNSDGNFIGYAEITIPKKTIDAKYKLVEVYAEDSKWNYTDNYEGEELIFEVIGSGVTDMAGPEFISIESTKSSYKRGEEVEVTVILKDESPIDYIELDLFSNGEYVEYLYFDDFVVNSDGYYESTTTIRITDQDIHDFSQNSIYSLDYGEAYDIYGNKTVIDAGILSFSFELYGKPDLEAPKVIEIIKEKNQYRRGDTVQYKVVVSDESEVDYVILTFAGEEGNLRSPEVYFYDFGKTSDGNYIGYAEFQIPVNTIDAYYELVEVYTSDIKGNFNAFYENLDISFEVVGTGVTDTTGPEIINIVSNKSSYYRGEEIEIKVTLRDESPIESLELEFEYNNNSESFYFHDFELNEEGYYVGTQTIRILDRNVDDFNQTSEYILSGGYVEDLYGNRSNIAFKDFSLSVELFGESDLEAPILVNIELEEREYNLGDKIEVTVTASDYLGVESAYLEFELIDEEGNVINTIYMYVGDFEYNSTTGLYQSTYSSTIWNGTSNGTYKLSKVELSDYAYNSQEYSADEGNLAHNLSLTIKGVDDKAPVIENIVIEENQYLRGEEIKVTIIASDADSIIEATLLFETEDGTVSETVYVYNFEELADGKYEGVGSFRIDQLDDVDVVVKLLSATIMDIWGNSAEYDLSDLNENIIILPNEDQKGPTIHDLEIGQKEYMRGEDIEVSVIVSDESAINGVELIFREENSLHEVYAWIDNFVAIGDGKFKGTGIFKIYDEKTNWIFTHGTAFDEFNNQQKFDDRTLKASVQIVDNPDNEAPKVISIVTDKEYYLQGDKIKFTVTVTDDNKVNNVYLTLGAEQAGGFTSFIIEEFQQIEGTNTYIGTLEANIPNYYFNISPLKLIGVDVSDEYNNRDSIFYNYEHPELNDPILDLVLRFGNNDEENIEVKEITRTEIISYVTEYIENSNLLAGSENVLHEGTDGVKEIVENVTFINGEHSSSEVLRESIIKAVQNRVIEIGTKAYEVEDTAKKVVTEISEEITEVFEIEYVYNPELLVGTQEITREGVNGVRKITEEVTYVGGKEVLRKLIDDQTIASISQIVQVGTKAPEIEDIAKTVKEETRTETISFETEIIYNPEVLVGEEKVIQVGQDGLREVIEEVTYIGKEVINRKELSSQILTESITQIIEIGSKAFEIENNAKTVTKESSEEVVAEFDIEYVNNSDLFIGTEQTSREGRNGIRTIVVEVTSIGDKEVSRRVISDTTTDPINKVIQVGTKAFEIEDIAKTVQEETRTEAIPFEIEKVYNPELLVGTERVKREGQAGLLGLIEEVTYIGSEVTNRYELSREILTNPTNRIIEVGTKAFVLEENTTKIVTDSKSGVKVSLIGSDNRLNLVVSDVTGDFSNVQEVLGSNYTLYDIHFEEIDGVEISPSGTVQITIPYEYNLRPLRVYYFGDNFEVTKELDFEDTGDSIVFSIDRFSYFGIGFATAEPKDTKDNTGMVVKVEAGELNDVAETLSKTESSSENAVVNIDAESGEGDLPPTGEASMAFTQILGVIFTTIGAALGFKKKD